MRFFIDAARIEEIRKANNIGTISGVIANASLVAGESGMIGEVIAQIASLVDGPIGSEVSADAVDAEDMIAAGQAVAALHPNIVVKIPMTAEGLKACKELAARGVRTNVSMVFSANQALVAARAGATYVSPFMGRLNDISQRGVDLIREIADLFSVCDVETQIIATNIHNPVHVTDCELAGADIAVVSYAMIEQLARQPLLNAGTGGA